MGCGGFSGSSSKPHAAQARCHPWPDRLHLAWPLHECLDSHNVPPDCWGGTARVCVCHASRWITWLGRQRGITTPSTSCTISTLGVQLGLPGDPPRGGGRSSRRRGDVGRRRCSAGHGPGGVASCPACPRAACLDNEHIRRFCPTKSEVQPISPACNVCFGALPPRVPRRARDTSGGLVPIPSGCSAGSWASFSCSAGANILEGCSPGSGGGWSPAGSWCVAGHCVWRSVAAARSRLGRGVQP